MLMPTLKSSVTVAALFALFTAAEDSQAMGSGWQQEFNISKCKLQTTGRNEYFILEPSFQLVLEGGDTRLQITVLNETKMVSGANT
jgi:hypothetical protein